MSTEAILALVGLALPTLTWALDRTGLPMPKWVYAGVAVMSFVTLVAAGLMFVGAVKAPDAPHTRPLVTVADQKPNVTVSGSPGSIIAPSGGDNRITNYFGPKKVAPKLLRTGRDSVTENADGTVTFIRHLKMNAPYEGAVIFVIKARGLMRASVDSSTPRDIETPTGTISVTGGGMQQNVLAAQDFYSTTIPAPKGAYDVTVVTSSKTPVEITVKFQE